MLDPQVPNGVYAWSTGAATQMLNVSARGIYAVEVTDAFGCVTSDTIAVTQSRGVSLPADTSFCAGNTLTLNANVGQGNYFWSPTGATGPVQFVQTSGNYAVNYVDNFGCTSTDNIMVDVVNDPQAQFSYFNQYYSVAFSDMSADATSYLWTFGDGDSSTAANPTHVYPGPSKYRVQLLVTNACGEDLYEDVISIGALPGFEENLEAGQFNVYPNPNSGDFTVSLNAEGGDYTLEVLTLEGKSIFMNEVNDVQPGLNNYEVSLDGLASGVYFVKVTGAENSQVQKINIH
jgi:PKD repeat protein